MTTTTITTTTIITMASPEKFARHTLIRGTFARETLTNFVILALLAKKCLVKL